MASLCLADGMPLVWASRLLGARLPERVAGADLLLPLMRRAAERHWRVYLLGSSPAVATRAAELLRQQHQVQVVGTDSPEVVDATSPSERAPVVERIQQARPHLLVVAFGAPKQEVWIHHAQPALGPVVALGLGASLDFLTGASRRAPEWARRAGLEWLHRLLLELRRLWRRYLLRDPAFALILLRSLLRRRAQSA